MSVNLYDRLPAVPRDRTLAITVGRWGGFYRRGRRGFWRVCFGFVAVTYFRAEFTQVVAAWLDKTEMQFCYATSPEQEPCILPLGHEGTHVPPRGRGWSWG